VLKETHRPDAFRMEAFEWEVGAIDLKRPREMDVRHRTVALRRFQPAARAAVFSSDDRHFQSEKVSGKIVDQRGPYLLSGNWWDEKCWARAEWDMQLKDRGLFRAHENEGTWKIDGIYD